MHLGMPELLLILGIAVLIFGPKKLGSLGKGLGDGIRNFKDGLSGPSESENKPSSVAPPAETPKVPEEKKALEEKK